MTTQEANAILRKTWTQWRKHDVSRIGAALAYYTTSSIAAVLLIATAIAGFFFGADAASAQVSTQIRDLIGPTGAGAFESALANAGTPASGAIATLIGLATLLLGATTMFTEIQGALNTMWEAPPSIATGILPILNMLVWVYYSSQILLFGAQFTQVYSQQRRERAGAPSPAKPSLRDPPAPDRPRP